MAWCQNHKLVKKAQVLRVLDPIRKKKVRVLTGTGTNGYGSWRRLRVAKDPYPYGPVPVGTRPPPDPAGPCGSGGPACGYGEAPYPHVPLRAR